MSFVIIDIVSNIIFIINKNSNTDSKNTHNHNTISNNSYSNNSINSNSNNNINNNSNNKIFLDNFDYVNYEKSMITTKMENYSGWMNMNSNQYYFLNGIIRKHKPKNCLEVGVAEGGSSILILNAIKDINDSKLVSLDLKTNFYINRMYKTGYRVKQYFPELTNNWQLFTGEQLHIFLDKLQMKFDFLFLDTAHITPGELINLIEVLQFLEDNAIIVLHDIVWHHIKESEGNIYFFIF